MNDQATRLRQLRQAHMNNSTSKDASSGKLRTLAVTSGKGGVGKTSLSLNLGIALARAGKRVAVMDTDLNLGNLDVLLGLSPRYTLRNVIAGEVRLDEIIVEGPAGVHVIPASSGALELVEVDAEVRRKLVGALRQFENSYDYLLLDTPAGLSAHVLDFLEIADQTMVVTTADPASIIDAYALIKVLLNGNPDVERLHLVVNQAASREAAAEVFDKLNLVIHRFLGQKLGRYTCILRDAKVGEATTAQQAFIEAHPECDASAGVERLSQQILGTAPTENAGQEQFVPMF